MSKGDPVNLLGFHITLNTFLAMTAGIGLPLLPVWLCAPLALAAGLLLTGSSLRAVANYQAKVCLRPPRE